MIISRVIYDFGANNGVNLDYYLGKDRVVAVEANARLCDEIADRFAEAIEQGRLVVLKVALSDREAGGTVPFYIHKTNHLLSRLTPPRTLAPEQYEIVQVECRTAASIVREYGPPAYVKIDLEDFDGAVLKSLFSAGIFPAEVSAEAGSVDVFALMAANDYDSFTLVDGSSVAKRGFPEHSAGPFGEDIGGRWDDADTFLYTLAGEGLGWKDIHASRVIPPAPRPSGTAIAIRMAKALARRTIARLR
jgi:FkbM family methyltransferase